MATILNKPDNYSFLGNLKNIEISSDVVVPFILKHNNDIILDAKYTPDSANRVILDLTDIVKDYLFSSLPAYQEHASYDLSQFSYDIDSLPTEYFSIINGGVAGEVNQDIFFRSSFLTWQPKDLRTKYNQPQWLYYLALEESVLKIMGYFSDSSSEEIEFANLDLNKINVFNLQFASLLSKFTKPDLQYFDCYVESIKNGVQLSYTQRYILISEVYIDNYFIFKNSLGGYDSILLTGKLEEQNSSIAELAQLKAFTKEFNSSLSVKYSKNSGYFNMASEYNWVADFFRSDEKYWINKLGQIENIIVENSSYSINKEEPNSFSFTFYKAEQQSYSNLSRFAEINKNIRVMDNKEIIPLPPRVVDLPALDLDDNLLFPIQSPFLESWGITTWKQIKEAMNREDDQRLTSLEKNVKNLQENQVTGVETYETFAELPANGELKISYKVTNDPDSSLNGYWTWDGTAYKAEGASNYVRSTDITQELGEDNNKLISQSATTKFIKETQGYLNIDLLVPLPTGQYYDLASAIQVIPANLRVPGCSIVFAINPYFEFQYYKYNHISVSAGWDNLKNWTPQNIGIYSSFIDYNVLLQYPRLSCIKSIKIENLAKENKNDDFYLLAMSQGNIEEQTLALGVNKIVNAEGVKIIKCTLTGIVINNDYSNVKFTGTYNAATIEIICDRSRFIANTNVQDQGEPWILLNSITRILKDSDDDQSLIINVSTEYPLPDGEFYTAVTARAAVTAEKRKNGLILQWISGLYDAFSYQQYTVKTNEFSDSVWNLPQNWMPLSLGLNTPYFGFTDVGKYPELAIFKSIEIYNPNNIKLPEFYILSIGQGNIQEQQIVLNVDKEVNSEGLKIYGVILKSSKLEDKHNVEFVGNYQSATFRVICDRSIINNRSFQSPDNPFIRINNIKEIKRYSLSGDESLFVEGYSFSEKFGADFVLDAAFYMSKEDQENWTYYIKQVAVEYGESKENYINIERYNTETTEDQLGNYYLNNIDSQGIATFIGTGTYGAHRNKLLAIRLKWSNAAVFKGTLYHDTATKAVFKDICFQGGLHTLDKYLPANRLRDFDNMPVGKYKVGTMDVFKKDDKAIPTYFYAPSYTFNEDCIQTIKNEKSYIIGQNQEPINKLKDLQYVDLGNRRLLDVSWDDKIWITDSSTKKLYYAQGVENAKADNWVEVNTPVNMPDGHYIGAMCMNNDGELIVVSYKALTQTNFSKIYKSDKNFTNWVEKQEFRSDATVEIPDWTLQQRGNRIIITGYGQHGTVPTEVAWYIYYSPDSGETWYDNLFNLGKLIDINLWEPDPALVSGMHIHGVGIDPYRGQLIVVSGDSSADIFYTTNLTEWEMNNDKTNNYLPSDSNALHWIRRPVMESMKYVNVYALNNALLLGSDALPNGIQRLNYTEEYPYLNENACTELKWAMQRNNGETGDYSFYGYTIARRSNNSPILCSMRYMGGVAESDHKRNMVFASWDGYNFSKIWEDNWDLTRELNGELIKLRNINHPVCRNDSYGNYIIQTSSDGTIGLVETYVLIISLNK